MKLINTKRPVRSYTRAYRQVGIVVEIIARKMAGYGRGKMQGWEGEEFQWQNQ